MAKVDGMTDPKPDFVYGLRRNYYPVPDDVQVSAFIDFLLEVVPFLHQPSSSSKVNPIAAPAL